jgi:hypothetical protein
MTPGKPIAIVLTAMWVAAVWAPPAHPLAEPGPGAEPARPVRGLADAPAYGTYAWPVHGRVIRGFEDPQTPYGAGHRGIDIASPFGSVMVAAQDGVVAFSGFVGGSLFISVDHSDGVRTTYSWLSAVDVRKGDVVHREQPIGATGHGHPEIDTPHLHFGARVGATYIDPMLLLEGSGVVSLIHLAPLEGFGGGSDQGFDRGGGQGSFPDGLHRIGSLGSGPANSSPREPFRRPWGQVQPWGSCPYGADARCPRAARARDSPWSWRRLQVGRGRGHPRPHGRPRRGTNHVCRVR